jgi:hypothetical protein
MPFFGGGGGGATVANMVGATSSTAGTAGLVPAPAAGKNTRALFSDASFGEVPLLPQYKNTVANRYIRNWTTTANTGYTPSASLRLFGLIYCMVDGEIDILATATSAGPTSAVNVHIALWDNSQAGEPSTYLCGGTVSSGTSGNANLTVTISPAQSVKRGFYWISVTPESNMSSGALARTSADYYALNLSGSSTLAGTPSSLNFNYTCLTSYTQTTHETFALGSNLPTVGFQWV